MRSLNELYKIGNGPSSSHTMGPRKAAAEFLTKNPRADLFRVTLYGSLAATGKGHLTDVAVESVLKPAASVEIVWKPETFLPFHPNGMLFEAINDGEVTDSWTIYSTGGGCFGQRNHFDGNRPGGLRHVYHRGDNGLDRQRRDFLLGIRRTV